MIKRKSTDCLNDIIQGITDVILVEKPCKITKIHSQYLVDIEYYDKYQTDVLYKVPVKHLQTQNAFIFPGLKVGDRGTVKFLDNDISYYKRGSEDFGNEIRSHNINDGIFSLGFYPAPEQYIVPDGELVIGTNSGALITLDNGNINITGGNITISASSVTIENNTFIDGINFLEHQHSNGNNGQNTGSVVT